GIGPRQAARFVFFMLKEPNPFIPELVGALKEMEERIALCGDCFATMERESADVSRCAICRDRRREREQIAIMEKESDMQNLEKTGAYHGLYHILGGVISPLDPESPKRIRLKELYRRIESFLQEKEKCEVILATNPTTEGDTTALYIERILAPLKDKHAGLAISRLGRGLSLGAEVEYADEITLKNALTNRK
ncbi:MAG: recombination protein RecR, partial [Candidatus Sungbacteria bacterium]|nr:recombination protein RecR [Candidatus Sungbacteria bacterium]